jgi:hypothetical protein
MVKALLCGTEERNRRAHAACAVSHRSDVGIDPRRLLLDLIRLAGG